LSFFWPREFTHKLGLDPSGKISYHNGQILDLNQNLKEVKYEDTDIYKTYMTFLQDPERMQKYLFMDE
ncbi:MAG TPA: hypothetical protein PLI23_11020, partial [Thermoclostridium caenicola]|uniref:hypothetical protein n=1 Tax=Thermoclostridium caenicola TaxID=659425 RepID=UPI002BB0F29A|nr:hypothetical protein [Thermoclostridium caenicola]